MELSKKQVKELLYAINWDINDPTEHLCIHRLENLLENKTTISFEKSEDNCCK